MSYGARRLVRFQIKHGDLDPWLDHVLQHIQPGTLVMPKVYMTATVGGVEKRLQLRSGIDMEWLSAGEAATYSTTWEEVPDDAE